MSSSVIIFDADYVSELTGRMNIACQLLSEAVMSLKSAQNHDNWKCKERTKIIEDFDNLNLRLACLDSGVNETTKILGASVSRFAALESQYESQADSLSDELTNNHGFRATVNTGGSSQGGEIPDSGGSTTPDSQAPASGGGTQSPQTPQPGGGTSGGSAGTPGSSGNPSGAQTASANSQADQSGTQSGSTSENAANSGAASGAATGLLKDVKPGTSPSGQQTQQEPGRTSDSGAESESGANSETAANTGSESGGGGVMSVNLPVTYIPDNPGAAAKGIRSTQAIADAAVSSVAAAMAEILSSPGADISSSAENLIDAYNAGRSIFENSAAIMANPTQAHTAERLAMAEGIVTLAGSSSSGFSFLNQPVISGALSSDSGRSNFTQNAGSLMAAVQGNSEASEFANLLGVFAGSSGDTSSTIIDLSGSESSGGKKLSFFDKILEELKKAFNDENNGSTSSGSTLASSSPVMEFLNNFVMDQAV